MKIAAFLVLLLAICGCKQKVGDKPGASDKNESVMLGKWTMCATESDEGTFMANVCTVWLFNPDHSAAVGLGAPQYPFSWYITGKSLLILNKTGSDFIPNGSYTLTEKKDKISRLVIISDTVNHIRYFLRRD